MYDTHDTNSWEWGEGRGGEGVGRGGGGEGGCNTVYIESIIIMKSMTRRLKGRTLTHVNHIHICVAILPDIRVLYLHRYDSPVL